MRNLPGSSKGEIELNNLFLIIVIREPLSEMLCALLGKRAMLIGNKDI